MKPKLNTVTFLIVVTITAAVMSPIAASPMGKADFTDIIKNNGTPGDFPAPEPNRSDNKTSKILYTDGKPKYINVENIIEKKTSGDLSKEKSTPDVTREGEIAKDITTNTAGRRPDGKTPELFDKGNKTSNRPTKNTDPAVAQTNYTEKNKSDELDKEQSTSNVNKEGGSTPKHVATVATESDDPPSLDKYSDYINNTNRQPDNKTSVAIDKDNKPSNGTAKNTDPAVAQTNYTEKNKSDELEKDQSTPNVNKEGGSTPKHVAIVATESDDPPSLDKYFDYINNTNRQPDNKTSVAIDKDNKPNNGTATNTDPAVDKTNSTDKNKSIDLDIPESIPDVNEEGGSTPKHVATDAIEPDVLYSLDNRLVYEDNSKKSLDNKTMAFQKDEVPPASGGKKIVPAETLAVAVTVSVILLL